TVTLGSYGVHTLTATQTQNSSPASAASAAAVTLTPPAPTLGAPASVVGLRVPVSGTGLSGSTVNIFDGSTSLGTAFPVDGSGNWSGAITLGSYGVHTLT